MPTVRDRHSHPAQRLNAAAAALDAPALFGIIYRALALEIQADTCFVGLYDEVSRTIDVIGQVEFGVEMPGGSFPLGSGLTSEVIRTRQARRIDCWSREAPPVRVQYLSSTPGLPESALIAPLVYVDQVLGVIAVHRYAPDAFTDRDLQALESIAAQAATPI